MKKIVIVNGLVIWLMVLEAERYEFGLGLVSVHG